jgi:hypothetical protein
LQGIVGKIAGNVWLGSEPGLLDVPVGIRYFEGSMIFGIVGQWRKKRVLGFEAVCFWLKRFAGDCICH